MIESRTPPVIVLGLWLVGTSCSRPPPPPPPPPPLAPEVEQEMYAAVLERILVSRFVQAGAPVAAICLGLGEDAAPPPVDLLFRFMAGQPPLQGAASCTRTTDEATSLPVVQTLDGAPGLFLSMMNAPFGRSRVVTMRFERTAEQPLTIRCRVDLQRAAPPAGAPPDAQPGAPPDASTLLFRLRGC